MRNAGTPALRNNYETLSTHTKRNCTTQVLFVCCILFVVKVYRIQLIMSKMCVQTLASVTN